MSTETKLKAILIKKNLSKIALQKNKHDYIWLSSIFPTSDEYFRLKYDMGNECCHLPFEIWRAHIFINDVLYPSSESILICPLLIELDSEDVEYYSNIESEILDIISNSIEILLPYGVPRYFSA